MIFYEHGSATACLSPEALREGIATALDRFHGGNKILIVPPDITRFHSRAGELTRLAYERNPRSVAAIIPALGTHTAMSTAELSAMFGAIPQSLFIEHRWRSDCTVLGEIPASFIEELSGGVVRYPIQVSINRILLDRSFDCILSISQVVPHEVAGMAGYSKNIVVGLGGAENIHKTHFLGAAYGIERIMGRSGTPVRRVFDCVLESYLADLPIIHAITVIGQDERGGLVTRGLYIGNDRECFEKASALSRAVNIHLLEKRLRTVVAFMDPREYKSMWLANKAIYRSRMAIADGGRLIVLAPGVKTFGEDGEIDRLIRAHGYKGTAATMEGIERDQALRNNLSAAAHLIHGSSEGRFSITYCAGGLSAAEIESVGFLTAPLETMLQSYDPARLVDGWNRLENGEEVYFLSKPGTGLWAAKDFFS